MEIVHNQLPAEIPPIVAVDTEFYGQSEEKLHLVHGDFAALAFGTDEQVYIITDEALVPEALKRLQTCTSIVMQNALYDLRQLSRYGVFTSQLLPFIYDTMIVEKLLGSNYYANFNLDALARRYLMRGVKKEMYGKLIEQTATLSELVDYIAEDVATTYAIYRKQLRVAMKESLMPVYVEIEEPTMRAILDMPPIRIDVDAWQSFIQSIEQQLEAERAKISINPTSPKQVKEYFYLKYRVELSTTDEKEMTKLAKKYPEAEIILRIRELSKISGTYGREWLEKYVRDGFVASDFKVIGTITGRFSSSNPNLQNIPARKYPQFRTFFIPRDNHVMIVADISQQEPRLLAVLSGDKALIEAFNAGTDVHLEVARRIFNNPDLTKENKFERSVGKAINLGISYGLTPRGLAENAGIPLDEAEAIIVEYFNHYPGVERYMQEYRDKAMEYGYVETLSGRRIYINPYSKDWMNVAVNAPIQGSGADMTKLWIINIWSICKKLGIQFPLVATVHDEIVLDVPKEDVYDYLEIVGKAFEQAVNKLIPNSPVPFIYEAEYGTSWACKQ